MLKHIWTVVCQRSITDQETNTLSLLDVVETIKIKKVGSEVFKKKEDEMIMINFPFEIVTFWTKKDKESSYKEEILIEFIDSNGKKMRDKKIMLDFKKGTDKIRFRVKINGLQIHNEGIYNFCVRRKESGKWQKVATIPVEVLFN